MKNKPKNASSVKRIHRCSVVRAVGKVKGWKKKHGADVLTVITTQAEPHQPKLFTVFVCVARAKIDY